MELWIKSQDREMLTKIDYVYLENSNGREILGGNHYMVNKFLGLYPTRERALEVLDEIQNKLKTLLYLKPNVLLRLEDIKAGKSYFEELNKQEFITCDNNFEIIPISTHVVVYEMPKE